MSRILKVPGQSKPLKSDGFEAMVSMDHKGAKTSTLFAVTEIIETMGKTKAPPTEIAQAVLDYLYEGTPIDAA